MKKKLERKRFAIKNEQGEYIGKIGAVSIVSKPAIERSFGLFADIEVPKKIEFQIIDKEKMIICGPAMIPEIDILRFDRDTESYYYCYFSEQDVTDYAEYFMRYSDTRQANFEHEDNFLKDFFIAETWIVEDPKMDKCVALGFKDIPKGTWMISYRCTNEEVWNQIKDSSLSGFSIEIELSEFKEEAIKSIVYNTQMTDDEKLEAIKKIIYEQK